ncbi:DUF479 domain-containing protein [Salinimonas marina]|uniref:DUF479 domain-containing protein n=1 Tax=Salinimonas marina TaxID=2785918 RepID=A0A7S9HC28_9ALTE|nr:ACP phosphodiesterase [Salinimonas marina]QPG04699.1 DUF479 domain-containing protein [Salinimonas marina]
MNYLAHLALAQPTSASVQGNLLGDFMRGCQHEHFDFDVQCGLNNHRFVDRFTDEHAKIREAKSWFSSQRRRFAGIILDVSFDHFLISHWSQFYTQSFERFCEQRYALLQPALADMPLSMQRTVTSMLKHRWLDVYRTPEGLARALDNTAARIRFRHAFTGSIDEVMQHYAALKQTFLDFYPQLMQAVVSANIESGQAHQHINPALKKK